ncbi:hypothetical protein PISL3812_01369 [Talaromyces islandicus]|uniref:Cytochrome P450 n=1 Tax=Talaromyces islandicus TaxID=28573 RepID=A0A0U1LLY2_TALIS|nr:hypothetical protein PISL3812_01369 [Talaromyces islandicus]
MASWTLLAIVAAVLLTTVKPAYVVCNSYILTVVSAILASWVLRFIYSAILYPTLFTPLKHIPMPPTRSWISGSADGLALKFPIDLARKWTKTVPNNGLIRYYVIGNLERVLVVSPKAISDLLVSNSYDFVRPEISATQLGTVTGEGLLVAEGDVHRAQRKSLMPSFSYRHIKDLYPIFWSKAIEMTDEIEKTLPAKNYTIQIGNWASRAMLDIIGLAGMDYDLNSLQDPNNELSRHYSKLLTPPTGIQRLVAILCLFVVGFKWYFRVPTAYTRTVMDSVQYIRNVTKEIIREKQAKLERKEDIGVDILSVAMRSGNFSDENLVDQVMTFLAAGHETTSSAFQFAVYALSKHPEMQTLLREEVSKNLPASLLHGKEKKEPIPAAVIDKNFPYLTAFLSEVLRFYPSVPFTAREAARDTTLAGQHIPKGTNILIAPDITNKDEDFWGTDAHVFNPDRWLSGSGDQDGDDAAAAARRSTGGASSNYAYSTFIHGPRSCIGQGFARAELAIFVAVWVSRFEVVLKDPEKKLDVRQMITQAPADGVVVRVKPLDS